jgi:hypothetical protein
MPCGRSGGDEKKQLPGLPQLPKMMIGYRFLYRCKRRRTGLEVQETFPKVN